MSESTTLPPPDQTFNGNRKLVRPSLAARTPRRDHSLQEEPLSQTLFGEQHHHADASHAEVFYFQKQIQQKTEMIVVLDDGEMLEGQLEWYDRCVLKMCLNNRQRVMVYKSSIKYLYKAAEGVPSILK